MRGGRGMRGGMRDEEREMDEGGRGGRWMRGGMSDK